MRVGVLALQGAFIEHERVYRSQGHEVFEIRQLKDLDRPFDLLVLPGGESTVQRKLLDELHLFEPLRKLIAEGLPTVGTCAGLILLADHFKLLPIKVKRNAYGRQLGSFTFEGMTFIRAPAITEIGEGVEVLSTFEGAPTGVKYKNLTAFAWHPELSDDTRVAARFLQNL